MFFLSLGDHISGKEVRIKLTIKSSNLKCVSAIL